MKRIALLGIILLTASGFVETCYGDGSLVVSRYVVSDSEEPYNRRIYSYDMDLDGSGVVHLVYARPVVGGDSNRCEIIYTHGEPAKFEANSQILTMDGTLGSISTHLRVGVSNVVHVCYIKGKSDPETSLYYRRIVDGVPGTETFVAAGGWHTRMAVDADNNPIFARDSVTYPELFTYDEKNANWSMTPIMLTAPAYYYMVGNLIFDRTIGRYHLTFSDNIVLHPRCAWGVSSCSGSRFGKYHYAYSDDGVDWVESTINDEAHLWEYEYWTGLTLDREGNPYAWSFNMNPDSAGPPPNANLKFGRFDGSAWQTQIIAGTSCPPEKANAGMGAGIVVDENGLFWGAWDNSPAEACNGFLPNDAGNTALGFSRDGRSWSEIKTIRRESRYYVEEVPIIPYSAEGYCRVSAGKGTVYILELGDHINAKLYLTVVDVSRYVSSVPGLIPVTGDFDGDGKAGYGIYYPPTGYWQIKRTKEGLWENHFGYDGTEPITGDFDGDDVMDFGCYFPPTGAWYIFKSRDGFWTTNFGYDETDPIQGDFDGDGIDDFGCYFPPSGSWYIYKSHDGFWENHFGYGETQPITGDFDGDGIDDFGCYYPPSGSWYIYKSHDGFWVNSFGYDETLPITGDFDGDGIDDFGCYYPPDGSWYIYKSRGGFWTTQFGYTGTLPVTGDFDGDGLCDFGCFDPNGGYWFMYCSRAGFRTDQSVVY